MSNTRKTTQKASRVRCGRLCSIDTLTAFLKENRLNAPTKIIKIMRTARMAEKFDISKCFLSCL